LTFFKNFFKKFFRTEIQLVGKIDGHIEIFDDFFLNKKLVDLVVGKSNTQLDFLLF